MSKLTKQLKRDWANLQRIKASWRWFKEAAADLYKISPKEVANRVQP